MSNTWGPVTRFFGSELMKSMKRMPSEGTKRRKRDKLNLRKLNFFLAARGRGKEKVEVENKKWKLFLTL
jgi:hypothetical protein